MSILKAFIDGYKEGLDKQVPIHECVSMLEKLFKQFDVNLSEVKIDDSHTWWIERENSGLYVKIDENEILECPTLEVTSPILKLPARNILPFYRKCLELNSILVGCAITVCEDRILITSERSLRGLDYQEVEDMVVSVASFADSVIEEVSEEFSAKIFSIES